MANGINGYTVKEILDKFVIPPLNQVVEDVGELKETVQGHDGILKTVAMRDATRKRWISTRCTIAIDWAIRAAVIAVLAGLGIHYF